MNFDNPKILIKCYEDNLELIYNQEHDELFKWRAVHHSSLQSYLVRQYLQLL